MNLVPVHKDELDVDAPLEWALYDQDHNLLVPEGGAIGSIDSLNHLLETGVYRELSWESRDENGETNSRLLAAEDSGGKESGEKHYSFDDMHLHVEDRLQLQPPELVSSERFPVRVIGFVRGVSLLVTTPVDEDGLKLQLKEGDRVVMRSFKGQNAFGFACSVKRICKLPIDYIHLTFPTLIEGIVIRKAPRIKTQIIATAQSENPLFASEPVAVIIANLSANGVGIDAKGALGDEGDIVRLSFRAHIHNMDALLSVKGKICALIKSDEPGSENIRHGIEFHDLQPTDSIILQSMVYQNMVESPHKLI